MISGGLSGGSTSNVVKLALIANLAMIIIDIVQAVALLSTGPVGVALGIIFIGSGIHQTMSQIDYYKSGNDDQIIKDAVIGVATTGGLVALKKLAKHLKLLKGAFFTGDTKVLTEEGYKEIKEIEEGEKVESFNEDTGEKKLKKVTGVEITEAQKLIQIKTERAEIKVTPSHPMLKIGNTWVFAGVLRVGDKLVGYDGDEVEEEVLESPEKVYNLTIEDFHTYVVSEESVVVHNKCDLLGLKKTGKGVEQILPSVKTYEQARNKAFDLIDLGVDSKPYVGRLESSAGYGKIVGRQSSDGKVRWRLDFDPSKGVRINVEDFSGGKGSRAEKYVIPFEGGERLFKSLLKHLNR